MNHAFEGHGFERPAYEVRDVVEHSRYELVADSKVIGIADYERQGDVFVFPHTLIDPAHRKQGWGDVLVGAALDDVRSKGGKVVAQCWFVAEFLAAHAEYSDLSV